MATIEEMFAAAAHQHRSGQRKEAERLYLEILQTATCRRLLRSNGR